MHAVKSNKANKHVVPRLCCWWSGHHGSLSPGTCCGCAAVVVFSGIFLVVELLMDKVLHQLIGSPLLTGFSHPRWFAGFLNHQKYGWVFGMLFWGILWVLPPPNNSDILNFCLSARRFPVFGSTDRQWYAVNTPQILWQMKVYGDPLPKIQ